MNFWRYVAAVPALLVLACPAAHAEHWRVKRDRVETTRSSPDVPLDLRRRMPRFELLPAPRNTHTTNNLQECGSHGGAFAGGIACQALLPKGQVALVWDRNGSAAVDGYRIYRVDNGRHNLAGTQNQGSQITLYIIPPPSDGYSGKCYAVAAYSGSRESSVSNAACVGGGSMVQTASFSPQHIRSIKHAVSHETGSTSVGGRPADYFNRQNFNVGYFYGTDKGALGDFARDTVSRAALYFDLSTLAGKHIRSARLTLRVDTTAIDAVDTTRSRDDHETSCVARIGFGTSYWWNYDDWIEAAVAVSPGPQQGPDVSYNVTPLVAAWAQGRPNYGMVLLGEEENLDAFTEKACQTEYVFGRFALNVEYSE